MTHHLTLTLLIALACGQYANGQEPSPEDEVTEASRRFDVAFNGADFEGLAKMLTDDVVLTAAGSLWLSAEEALAFIESKHERRPGITLTTAPELVELGPDNWNVVSDRGRWIEHWAQGDEENIITGSYQAMWTYVDGHWRLAVLALVPVECRGPYCTQ